MQVLRIHAPGKISLDEVDAPEPGPRDAIVRVQACGICGSDLGYIQLGGVAGPRPEPTPLGHEFSAVVDRVGAEVSGFEPGQRVVVNPLAGGNIGNGGPSGAFAPEVLVTDVDSGLALFPIPDELSFDRAALAEPLGVGMQAVNRAEVSPGDKVAIFGAGPIGLMALAVLQYRGFDDVAISDLSDHRLGIAKQLGATRTLNPSRDDVWAALRELHGSDTFMDILPTLGTDAFIEASGAPGIIPDLLVQAKGGARVSVVALHRKPQEIDFMWVMAKQLSIRGSMAYPDDYSEMVRMLSDVDLSPVISHRFPLSEVEQAIEVARDGSVAGKVIVEPG
jgi:threonine dehydrogenase-like Zn-dependent dehydrogenase